MEAHGLKLKIVLALVLIAAPAFGQIAFRPDVNAEIPGANASGGRASYATVYIVDTILADRTAEWVESIPGGTYGSGYVRCNDRYAFENTNAQGARFIIYVVGGSEVFPYQDGLVLNSDSVTVTAAPAPERLIIRNDGFILNEGADNVIIEHLTFMIGDSVQSLVGSQRVFNCEADGIRLQVRSTAASDLVKVVLSHNTMLYGIDGNLDIFNNNPDLRKIDSVFVWRNLISAAVDIPTNAEVPDYSDGDCDAHSFNTSVGLSYAGGDVVDVAKGVRSVVYLENIMSHSDARNPLANADLTLANNLIYGIDDRATYLRNEGPAGDPASAPPTFVNILNNSYQRFGGITGALVKPVNFGEGVASSDTLVAGTRVFMSGNIDDFVQSEFYEDEVEETTPHVSGAAQDGLQDWTMALKGAEHLTDFLVPRVGANYHYRTLNETKILNDVADSSWTYVTGSVELLESVTNTNLTHAGGFPSITYTKRVVTDLPADPNGDSDADGYSNIEEWIYAWSLKAEFQENTILHGAWEFERYPWMHDTFKQFDTRMAMR